MATIVTLTEAKAQLQVLNSDQDTQIQAWVDAATDHVCKIIGDTNPPPAASLKQAVLLLVGEFDANRGTTIELRLQTNPLLMNLLRPYRKNVGI